MRVRGHVPGVGLMNLMQRARQFDATISALFPGWSRKRAEARLEATRSNYLAAAYDAARQTAQRKPRNTLTMSESGQLSDLDLDSIREWSRDTWRNNSIFSGICRRAADNVIGPELVLQPMSKDAGFNAEVKAGFHEYTRRGGGWEVSGRWDLGAFQRAGLFGVWRDGDLLMYRSDEGWQWFEGGQMGTPNGYDQTVDSITAGISMGPGQKPLRYWIADYSRFGYIDGRSAKGLRADKCVHVWVPEFLSGVRGVPLFASTLARIEDFDRYVEAHLLGAMARACVVGEINSPKSGAGAALDVRPIGQQNQDPTDRPKPRQLAPAMILETFTQEKFTMHSPNVQGGEFAEYFRGNVRLFGMPVGMPLELTFMDFSQTNFAAAKMAVMQSAKTQNYWRRSVVTDRLTAPIYVDYVDNVFPKSGARPADATKFEIVPPEQDWIQPHQETAALNSAISSGWDTRTRVARDEMGRVFTDVMRENAQEIVDARAICVEKGIDPDLYWREVRAELRADQRAAIDNIPPDNSPDGSQA